MTKAGMHLKDLPRQVAGGVQVTNLHGQPMHKVPPQVQRKTSPGRYPLAGKAHSNPDINAYGDDEKSKARLDTQGKQWLDSDGNPLKPSNPEEDQEESLYEGNVEDLEDEEVEFEEDSFD